MDLVKSMIAAGPSIEPAKTGDRAARAKVVEPAYQERIKTLAVKR